MATSENHVFCRVRGLPARIFQDDAGEPPAFPGVFGACHMYNTRRIRHVVIAGFALTALVCFLRAQTSVFFGPVESQYIKQELYITMRDGVRLFTAVYSPRDTTRAYPIMLHRTPYGIEPYGEKNYLSRLGPSMELQMEGFIFVYQDVRGRMMSDGEFVYMTPHRPVKNGPNDIDEASDAYDTIDWLVRNIPNNNGKVGMWGISYPGFYSAAGMIDAHPALMAVSPQGPIADWFIGDDFHHNGAFFLMHGFRFISSFGRPRLEATTQTAPPFIFPVDDGYDFYLHMGQLEEANRKYLKNEIPFWNDIMEHESYDAYWQSRNLLPHFKNIRPAVLTVGGWYDAENLYGTLGIYQAVEKSSPDAYNILVMGPWYHGAWAHSGVNYLGDIFIGADTAEFYRREIEYPFFMRFLKDAKDPDLPEAYIFDTGINEWKKETAWPPEKQAVARKLQLCSGGRLLWDSCGESPKNVRADDAAFDEYVSDPSRPVPYMNNVTTGMAREYMVADQRFATRRTDVLVYASSPLDHDVSVWGPVSVNLNVSTTGTDADFVVKLIDVYPDEYDSERYRGNSFMKGYQRLVRGEPFRGKFRNGFSNPEAFVPGETTRIEFVMPDIAHTFLKGHRIMVQIQSSWFPLVDRNPQKFVNIRKASAGDFQKATQKIFHSPDKPSYISLGIQ